MPSAVNAKVTRIANKKNTSQQYIMIFAGYSHQMPWCGRGGKELRLFSLASRCKNRDVNCAFVIFLSCLTFAIIIATHPRVKGLAFFISVLPLSLAK